MLLIVLPSKQILCLFYWTWNSRLRISHPTIKIMIWNKQDCTAIWFESSITEFFWKYLYEVNVLCVPGFFMVLITQLQCIVLLCGKLWWQAHRFQSLGWLWQEEMFHGDDRFSLARSSLAAVLPQPSTGMLAQEPPPPTAGGMGHALSSHPHGLSWGHWVLWKGRTKFLWQAEGVTAWPPMPQQK